MKRSYVNHCGAGALMDICDEFQASPLPRPSTHRVSLLDGWAGERVGLELLANSRQRMMIVNQLFEAFVKHMGIDLGGRYIGMAEHLLDRA